MNMQTVFWVHVWMYDEHGEGVGGGNSLRPDLESALEAVREMSARYLPRVTDKEILKIKITVYEAEHIQDVNLQIMKMMLRLGFPLFDCE